MRKIDADAAVKSICRILDELEDESGAGATFPIPAFKAIMEVALKLELITPTIEAEPVVRGEWKPDDEEYQAGWFCSECGGRACRSHDYCPHCGAKMSD